MPIKKIIVYCGSSKGYTAVYEQTAQALGNYMAERAYSMVYGAGSVGLMGVIADAMLAKGAEVIGVIPDFLKKWEVDHKGINETIVTESMHERKQKMAELGDAVIALPGGFGTLDELFEILTWGQLGLHDMPVGLLNIQGFFDPLLQMLQKMVSEGFVKQENLDQLLVDESIEGLFAKLQAPRAHINPEKWIERG